MGNSYIFENGTRDARKYNFALFYVKNYERWKASGATAIANTRSRDELRADQKLPRLTGEDKLGDYRANGDAIGGHGLKLKRLTYRGKKCFLVNEGNLRICKDFLNCKNGNGGILL